MNIFLPGSLSMMMLIQHNMYLHMKINDIKFQIKYMSPPRKNHVPVSHQASAAFSNDSSPEYLSLASQ